MKTLLASFLLLLLLVVTNLAQQANSAPVYVTLWFDTEDYILPQSDDAAKRLAEMLTRIGIKATFKLVGEKARVLEQRGRRDVIAALKKHEIGYHANTHSQQPTIAVYLQHAGWDDGRREFFRREGAGARDIQRIFGVTPICYGQPGSAWAPQSYPALREMGIRMYLDESNHVGINDQPFYYGNMLNVTKMRSNVVRLELSGADNLKQAQTKFNAAVERLRAQGGGTISIYYHPCEFIHTEFWDGVNFRRGANPPREAWKLPDMKPAAESEKAYNDFEQYVKFIKAQAGVRYVTAEEMMQLYADGALRRDLTRAEWLALTKAMQTEITFQRFDDMALSAAEVFALLNTKLLAGQATKGASSSMTSLDGPAHVFAAGAGSKRPAQITLAELRNAASSVHEFMSTNRQIPSEIWLGVNNLSPQDYLATLAAAFEQQLNNGQWPEQISVRAGAAGFEKYVAQDSPNLWGWVIFPEGFHAPKIMEHARLQAWTLKPALLKRR